jgi:hypothetical protein
MLLVMLEGVISLETFPFVERHYAEHANVPSFTPFLVNCANNTDIHLFQHLRTANIFSLILKIIPISPLHNISKNLSPKKSSIIILTLADYPAFPGYNVDSRRERS